MRLPNLYPIRRSDMFVTFGLALALVACGEQPLGDPADIPLVADDLPRCPVDDLRLYFDPGAIQPPGRDTGYDASAEPRIGAVFAEAFDLGAEGRLHEMARTLEAGARLPVRGAPGEDQPAYTVCQDPEAAVVMFRPPPGSGLALMAWRPGPARRVIVEAPHPYFEAHTLTQGVEAFFDGGARALIVSGAHRCASAVELACSGVTSVCGTHDGAYRESDAAHNPASVFHAMHVALAERYGSHAAVSLHGVGRNEVVVSDGTELGTGAGSPIGAAAAELVEALDGEAEVMSCNGVPGMVPTDRHCGTTNAQGRHLNAVNDVCLDTAADARGRFLHLEQPMHVRETPALRRAVMRRIFDRLDPLGALP